MLSRRATPEDFQRESRSPRFEFQRVFPRISRDPLPLMQRQKGADRCNLVRPKWVFLRRAFRKRAAVTVKLLCKHEYSPAVMPFGYNTGVYENLTLNVKV